MTVRIAKKRRTLAVRLPPQLPPSHRWSYVLFRVVRIPRRMMPLVRLRVCMRIAMNVISINAPVEVIHGIRVVPNVTSAIPNAPMVSPRSV